MTRMDVISKLSKLPFYGWLHSLVQRYKIRGWEARGRPNPPPHLVKQRILRKLATDHDSEVFIETGTHLGDMVNAMRGDFRKIYSIELSEKYHAAAVHRFRRYNHVSILLGDSGVVLPDLINQVAAPTLFWLDGHHSGGNTALGDEVTPIFKELDAIFKLRQPWVVAIDDARLFGADSGYPSMEKLIAYVENKLANGRVRVDSDVIVIEGAGLSARSFPEA